MDLPDIGVPVAFVAGRHDLLTPVDDVCEVADRLPHARVTVLPGSHFLPLDHTDLVKEAHDELAALVA